MAMDGWVRLHRQSMESRVYQDDAMWKLWCECKMRAAYCDRFVVVRVGRGTKTIELKRGQFIFGRNQWAQRLNQKPSSIGRRMKTLAEWGNVSIQLGSHFSIVTVCNYETYNPLPGDDEQPTEEHVDSIRTAYGQHTDTKKKDKKFKKGKKEKKQEEPSADIAFDEFWQATIKGNKTSRPDARKAWDKAVDLIHAVRIGTSVAEARSWLLERWVTYNASPKANGEFNPHPATWLNKGRYDDDEAAWQDGGNKTKGGSLGRASRASIRPGQRHPDDQANEAF